MDSEASVRYLLWRFAFPVSFLCVPSQPPKQKALEFGTYSAYSCEI